MPYVNHDRSSARRAGFTLIELLVAVTLLIMLLAGTSYIFDTTVRAMDETTAINEMTADSPIFYDILRKDIRGLETNGYFIIGQRSVTGYASHRMLSLGRRSTFRCDYMVLLTNTEQTSTLDTNIIGQWARIFWGHGPRTGSTGAGGISHSQFATDWIVMRNQILQQGNNPTQTEDQDSNNPGMLSGIASQGYWPCDDNPTGNNGWSYGHHYQRGIKCIYARIPRWYGARWRGNVAMPDNPVHPDYIGWDETTYWHDYLAYLGTTSGVRLNRLHVLPNCGDFRIQYAQPGDLRTGAGGTVTWHDPAARQVFQAGDTWPTLLKVTTQVFDPKDRIEKGRTFTAIVPVAR